MVLVATREMADHLRMADQKRENHKKKIAKRALLGLE